MKTIDYYICLISPWTYLGDSRLKAIAAAHGAVINYKPMNLGQVFPATGGLPLGKRAPQRQDYRLVELERWRIKLGVPLNLKPKYFPADERLAAGMVLAAQSQGADPGAFVGAVLSGVWTQDLNIADPATLVELANASGLDGEQLIAEARTDKIMDAWAANSEEAIARGVFGAPFYCVGDQMFWGQDRLDFVEAALERKPL